MRKITVALLVLLLAVGSVFAAESVTGRKPWGEYESGRDNVRVDGYAGQPGYVAFTDGNGNIEGYLYWATDRDCLAFVTDEGIDLTTAKLDANDGICVDARD